ncbi:hypothetical protein SDC9_123391 [bioreactor metagenome]|uniref:Uncharacterized protein n=1 Tax=bioreactor metagenome TaxID=1076179 RepID=A0A645CHG9_9ZZZZ
MVELEKRLGGQTVFFTIYTYRGIMIFNKSGEDLQGKGEKNGAGILQENILGAGILYDFV